MEKHVEFLLNQIKDIYFLKIVKESAKLPDITENFIRKDIICNDIKRFRESINLMIEKYKEMLMGEQRGN